MEAAARAQQAPRESGSDYRSQLGAGGRWGLEIDGVSLELTLSLSAALARRFHSVGAKVILASRDLQKLQSLKFQLDNSHGQKNVRRVCLNPYVTEYLTAVQPGPPLLPQDTSPGPLLPLLPARESEGGCECLRRNRHPRQQRWDQLPWSRAGHRAGCGQESHGNQLLWHRLPHQRLGVQST